MTLAELISLIAAILDETTGTVLQRAKALRLAGLLAVGVQGPGRGAQMTARDIVNLFLACALDHRYGADVAETVRLVRNLEFNSQSVRLVPMDGLTCWGARTAGEALENLIDDYRMGRVTAWAAGEKSEIKLYLDLRGSAIFILFSKPERDIRSQYAAADYAESGYVQNSLPIMRQMQINGSIFEKLARGLEL